MDTKNLRTLNTNECKYCEEFGSFMAYAVFDEWRNQQLLHRPDTLLNILEKQYLYTISKLNLTKYLYWKHSAGLDSNHLIERADTDTWPQMSV